LLACPDSIQDSNFYNFDETGFTMGMIQAAMVVTRSIAVIGMVGVGAVSGAEFLPPMQVKGKDLTLHIL
jgi:hypothetical protein